MSYQESHLDRRSVGRPLEPFHVISKQDVYDFLHAVISHDHLCWACETEEGTIWCPICRRLYCVTCDNQYHADVGGEEGDSA